MGIHFLDSSALQHRYVESTETSSIKRLVSSRRNECYISEWSVLEMASAFANRCRQGGLPARRYDAMNRAIIKDLANGRLLVRNTTTRDITRARELIRFAGVINRRRLKSGDALVASSCLDLAFERKERITFYMSDWGLYDILRSLESFTSVLTLQYVGVPNARYAGIPTRI